MLSYLALADRKEDARAMLEPILPMLPRPYDVGWASVLARVGEEDLAREALEAAVRRKNSGGDVAASYIAMGYSVLGEVELALDWLERSFENEGGIYYLRAPEWDNVAREPRFQELWDRVGLSGRHPAAE